jgi:putative heme-binding domain-containing protein
MTNRVRSRLVLAAATLFLATPLLPAADRKSAEKPPLDEPTILKGIKAPDGWNVTVFAMPPDVMYPTAVAAAPTGELYVAIDEQGSLGKTPGRGRVVKCVDTNDDGKADRFTTFAKMDHPRGVYFDASTDTLYVLHPPFVKAYRDSNRDGVADQEKTLVTGIVTEATQKARGADHTTNGFRVGIDGWMYIAMGDFGAIKAVGKDGATLQNHGGGIVRVRLDGTGLEQFSWGQRNICDVAVDPLLNVFTRDNTNDGGGWDVRLSHVVPTGNYGYPRLFKNFPDEIVPPLDVYGGGSPVGALYLDEDAFPAPFGRALYTVEWGRSKIYRHRLEPTGAGFTAKQEEFLSLPRPTDMDADAVGHLYVSSWINGGFAYDGPNIGYVARVTPKDAPKTNFPDLKQLPDPDLVSLIASPSAVTRQSAQREILKRGKPNPTPFQTALEQLASSRESLPVRVAAVCTLQQLAGSNSHDALIALTKQDDLREYALRALADKTNDCTVPAGPFIEALTDASPRVRLAAVWGLGRLGQPAAASQLMPLAADPDPLVAHVAIHALVTLRASSAALKAIDPSNPKLTAGALRVLQSLHDTQVVEALADKINTVTDPATRSLIYKTLCRLHWREADWNGDWWGTRPDTSGPYYKTAEWPGTPRVRSILQSALASEKPETVRTLVIDLQKNKVDFPELAAALQKLAAQDPSIKLSLFDVMTGRRSLTPDQVTMLRTAASSVTDPADVRVKALRVMLRQSEQREVLDAALTALAAITAEASAPNDVTAAVDEFARDARLVGRIPQLTRLAEGTDPAKRDAAHLVLVSLSTNKLLARDKRVEPVAAFLDTAWKTPGRTASLLRAIGIAKADTYADKVRALESDKSPTIAAAAKSAATQLGLNAAATPAGVLIESMKYDDVLAAVQKQKGDAKKGQTLFTTLGCAQCHTTTAAEPPKGPFLGGVAARYTRAELCESLLKPSAKIAQGFDTQWFKTKDDEDLEGFVTREAGDEVELRNILGVTAVLKKSDITERGKREISVMPEALLAKSKLDDLASLLAFLESLKGQ